MRRQPQTQERNGSKCTRQPQAEKNKQASFSLSPAPVPPTAPALGALAPQGILSTRASSSITPSRIRDLRVTHKELVRSNAPITGSLNAKALRAERARQQRTSSLVALLLKTELRFERTPPCSPWLCGDIFFFFISFFRTFVFS